MLNLRIPGPTPCPDEVLRAMGWQMTNHRSPEFTLILDDVKNKIKQLAQTKNDVFFLTSSGTGGLEAAIVNTLSPGDKILGVSNGLFGERFAIIAQRFGADVARLDFEWGQPVRPDLVQKALQADPEIKAVLITHNETSTGVTNDLASISSIVKEFDKLLLVDAISSLGSINLPIDEWCCDVTITASQKGWMVPPGMAMVFYSEKAWKANAVAKMPRFYWDFAEFKGYFGTGETAWTPALSIVFALSVSLDMMIKEGLLNIFARHKRVAQATRAGIRTLGLNLLADDKYASDTVTAVLVPEGLDVNKLFKILREEHEAFLARGVQRLGGKVFRIGHLGMVCEADITNLMSALRVALPQAGFKR